MIKLKMVIIWTQHIHMVWVNVNSWRLCGEEWEVRARLGPCSGWQPSRLGPPQQTQTGLSPATQQVFINLNPIRAVNMFRSKNKTLINAQFVGWRLEGGEWSLEEATSYLYCSVTTSHLRNPPEFNVKSRNISETSENWDRIEEGLSWKVPVSV